MSFPGADATCTIKRATLSLDPAGDEKHEFAALATGVPCRFYRPKGKDAFSTDGPQAATHRLWLPFGQDVTEKDIITDIVADTGATLATQAFIAFHDADPANQQHHVELDLNEVR